MKRLLLTAALAFGAAAFAQSSSTSGSTTDTNPVTGASGQSGSTTTSDEADEAGATQQPASDPGTLGTGGAGAEGGAMDAQASGQSESPAKKQNRDQGTEKATGGAGMEHGATTAPAKDDAAATAKAAQSDAKAGGKEMPKDMEAMQALGVKLPDDPGQFLDKVHHANQMELELAKLAKEKAVTKDVKKHAEMMEKDHTAMGKRLDELAKKMNHTFAEPKPLDDKDQKVMDAHKADMEKLRVLDGLLFDRAYLAHMVGEHDHDIASFTAALEKYDDKQLTQALAKELPSLNKHRDMTAGMIKNAPSLQAKAAHSKAQGRR